MKNFLELIASLFGKGALSRVMGTRTNIVRFPNQESQRFITTDLNIEAASDAAVKQAYKYAEELFPSYPQMNDAEKLIFEGNLRRLDNAITDRGLKIKELEETQLPSAQLKNLKERLEKKGEDLKKTIDEKKSQSIVQGAIDDFLKTEKILDDFDRTGYVRATVRQIMREDIQAGKLKLPKELEDQVMQGLGEPIDIWRKVYGEGALEQIDSIADNLSKLRTEEQAAQMARSKFKFEPDVNRPPGSYTPEEGIESNVVSFKKKPDEPEKFAMGGNVESKGLDYLMGLSRPYATGGRIGFQLGGLGAIAKFRKFLKKYNYTEKPNPFYDFGKEPKEDIRHIAEDMADKAFNKPLEELPKNIKYKLLDAANEEYINTLILSADTFATGGRVGFAAGTPKKILDLIAKANKALSKKKSMESMNPKTGELTIPKKPIKLAEEPKVKKYDQDMIKAANNIFPDYDDPKIAADQIAESYAEMKLKKNYNDLTPQEQNKIYSQAYDYVMDQKLVNDPASFIFEEFKRTNPERYANFLKASNRLEELSDLRSGQEIFETYDLETYNYLTSGKILQLLNQLKKPYKILDSEKDKVKMGFTSENFEGTGLKNLDEINFRTDKKQLETYLEDLYNKKQIEEAQTELFNLQNSGREPNASGGLNYLMGL